MASNHFMRLGNGRGLPLLQNAADAGLRPEEVVAAVNGLSDADFKALQDSQRSGFDALNRSLGGRLPVSTVSTTLGGDRKPSSVWKGLTNPVTLGFLAAPLGAAALFPAAGAAAATGAAGAGTAGAAGAVGTAAGAANAARGLFSGGTLSDLGDLAQLGLGVGSAVSGAGKQGEANEIQRRTLAIAEAQEADRARLREQLMGRLPGLSGIQRQDLGSLFQSDNPFARGGHVPSGVQASGPLPPLQSGGVPTAAIKEVASDLPALREMDGGRLFRKVLPTLPKKVR